MGIIFIGPGGLIYIITAFWGDFICERVVAETLGTSVFIEVISVVLTPFLLMLAPWYEGLVHGDWFPLLLVYGGGILGLVLIGIGLMINELTVKMSNASSAKAPRRTALAIIFAIFAMVPFYALYWVLFGYVILMYAHYDASFASGIGAFVFLAFGTNVLGTISGAAVTKWLFPSASAARVYYGLSIILIAMGVFMVGREMMSREGSMIVAGINIAIFAAAIFALKLLLRPGKTRLLSDS